MRVSAADVPVRRLVRSQCVYVTVGTTRTAMKEIVLMTTLPLYSTHDFDCPIPGRAHYSVFHTIDPSPATQMFVSKYYCKITCVANKSYYYLCRVTKRPKDSLYSILLTT